MCIENLSTAANWAQLIGLPIGLLALIYTAAQVHSASRVARGQFLLELEKIVQSHDYVHHRLTPDGEWSKGVPDSARPDEWCQIYDYAGFFETCELLMQDGALDAGVFVKLYGYRLKELVRNPPIRKMFDDVDADWSLFKSAAKRVGMNI